MLIEIDQIQNVYTLRFHLYKIQKQAKLNYGVRIQNSCYP